MKKIFFLSACAALLLTACSNNKEKTAGMSTRAQKNLEASRAVGKAFETGDVSKIDSFVAADFVDHTDRGDMNRDSLKSMITAMHNSDPTMKAEILQEFATDDYSATWYRFTGNSDGSMGMPKGPYDMKSIELVKHNSDGKCVEHWGYVDYAEMMKMMPSNNMGNMGDNKMPPKDTAK